ncbi:ATP-binding cassette domain-containing protein [Paenibacillus xylaniclasticus]|uniref:ATP-binding cassette domain-containing protein n=1 Tax=Paenibacillus xylaniclasticus TaxID=588083 RepID=UPI000FDC6DDE|nr:MULTISPECIES: ATP-binding cassette domain-containing protein [Paenibacillus]GFN30876.1 ABC transporter ATP-binding protein [Paenibacillus curdlanolyticus]
MLQLTGITKRFGRREVLHEINVSLDKGVIGLLGPNGAGKTTLLRLLATVYEPTSGSISLNGVQWANNIEQIRRLTGYLPQHVGLFPALTSYEYLDYICILRGITSRKERRSCIEQVLHEVNLEDRANMRIRRLSGGMKQRLGIAQAIIHEPELLLVDEPTAGLDPEERLRFRGLLRRLAEKRIVILSTHITEDVTMTCDKVCMMKNGHLQYFASLSDVVQIAAGHVWTLKADAAEYRRIADNPAMHLINASEREGSYDLRLMSVDRPLPDAVPSDPTLEEGYMRWLKAL